MKTHTTRRSRKLVALFAVAIMIAAFGVSGNRTSAAGPSEQVIFSGVGFAPEVAENDWSSPVGFWIWCQAEGTGPYGEHQVCAGAMYVYFQGLTKGVHGTVEEDPLNEGIYTMSVEANDGSTFSAELTNHTVLRGPRNNVTFTVTTPDGTSSGASTNAVVNVTGP